MGFVDLINAIPATFWGLVTGSFLTVLGVILTNAANTKRLRLQHEHEWRLESRERKLNQTLEAFLALTPAGLPAAPKTLG